MKATETPLLNMLKGPRQFVIPIYQRAYSWSEDDCAQLWEDILRVAEEDRYPAHFIGSVVYIEHGLYQATAIPQLLVIDGQQRLTTVTLLIEALARAMDSGPSQVSSEITARKLRNYFLLNPEEEGDLRYKLQLSQGDAPTLRAVLDAKELPEEAARHVVDNFEFFQERIESAEVLPEVVYRGLSKLLVVDVTLDREHDNPQLIFESLNSTGLDLSQSDLIRNYILMGLDPEAQKTLYEDHWRRMESILSRSDRDDVFDRFLRAWLTLRLGEVPNIRRGYETFKQYRALHADQPIEDLVADFHESAKHYACIALGQEEHPELARTFQGMKALRVDAPMPFLLHAYELWRDGVVSESDMVEIARLIESWVFRRQVCDIPSNVLSRTFATLPEALDDDKLLESLSAYLVLRSGRQRFPANEEFRSSLQTRNLYDFKHRQYCLTRLENHNRKERVDIGQYTIEHIMPQNENLSSDWRKMLGADWQAVQERWLHTLGNLTLTGYNPELSDRPFAEKRDMEGGFADSPLRLNRQLGKAKVWDAEAMGERAEALAKKAASLWPAPSIDKELIEQYGETPKEKRRRPQGDLDHFNMSPKGRALFDRFIEGAAVHDLEPTIWKSWIGMGKPGAGKPYPVIVFPRKDWILLRFFVQFEELEDPPSCAFAHQSKRGARRTRARVRTDEEVDACLRLLSSIPILLTGDLADEGEVAAEADDS